MRVVKHLNRLSRKAVGAPSLERPGWMGVWAICSSRCPSLPMALFVSLSGAVTELILKRSSAGGSRGSTTSPWAAGRLPHLPTQFHGAALPQCTEKGEKTAWPLRSGNEGLPCNPTSCSSCPRAVAQRRTAALRTFLGQSQACLGQLGAQSARVPSQTPQQPQPPRVRQPLGGRAEAQQSPAGSKSQEEVFKSEASSWKHRSSRETIPTLPPISQA